MVPLKSCGGAPVAIWGQMWYKNNMEYALKERIGRPVLFTGRKKELAFFLNWIDGIKKENSQSTALLARRKMGKTALMERLFNITFHRNDGVVPFYYEVKEIKMWMGDFCKDFFLTFIYQYMAFKTRKTEYLRPEEKSDFSRVAALAKKEKLDYLVGIIESVAHAATDENVDTLWGIVREAPQTIAFRQNEFVLQMIDEFQFLNAMIYRDKNLDKLQDDMAAGYLSTAESKVAPLLVSGSWVGWLMNELMTMLPSRFKYEYIGNMPKDEAVEMIYKFSHYFEVPVSEETVYLMAEFSEGSPFYISSMIRSSFREKNLTTVKGLTDVVDFETLDDRGAIKTTWMEYIAGAFPQVNDRNAKSIVLTRSELIRDLKLEMTDAELEQKLKALVKADIISQGQTNFDYRGVGDNIFDKVFRGVYEKEIREFDIKTIRKEYGRDFGNLLKRYKRLQGKYHYQQGYFAEYLILDQLRMHGGARNEFFKSITHNLAVDFDFCAYSWVWRYHLAPVHGKSLNVDILARAADGENYSLVGEVKSRETAKFSKVEVEEFVVKLAAVKEKENLDRVQGFIFSRSGFTSDAEECCREKGIAYSHDQRWLSD